METEQRETWANSIIYIIVLYHFVFPFYRIFYLLNPSIDFVHIIIYLYFVIRNRVVRSEIFGD